MNVVAFPNYFNVYDSVGEAYKIEGEKKLAIENYKRALELNPRKTQFEIKTYEDGKKILEELLKN